MVFFEKKRMEIHFIDPWVEENKQIVTLRSFYSFVI